MRFASLIAVALLAATAVTSPAQARSNDDQDRRIIVINNTHLKVARFYASNAGTGSWQEDVLGKEIIPAWGRQLFNLDDGTGYSQYDFKAVMESGEIVYRYGVNVCDTVSWTISE